MNSSRRYRDRRESEEGVNLIEGQATKKLCRERERERETLYVDLAMNLVRDPVVRDLVRGYGWYKALLDTLLDNIICR